MAFADYHIVNIPLSDKFIIITNTGRYGNHTIKQLKLGSSYRTLNDLPSIAYHYPIIIQWSNTIRSAKVDRKNRNCSQRTCCLIGHNACNCEIKYLRIASGTDLYSGNAKRAIYFIVKMSRHLFSYGDCVTNYSVNKIFPHLRFPRCPRLRCIKIVKIEFFI